MPRTRRAAHQPGCEHCYRVRLLGQAFWEWRAPWEEGLEEAANGYASEGAEYRATHPAPTFKQYLIQMTGAAWPMSGQRPRRRFIT
jgi:hypothetical protein